MDSAPASQLVSTAVSRSGSTCVVGWRVGCVLYSRACRKASGWTLYQGALILAFGTPLQDEIPGMGLSIRTEVAWYGRMGWHEWLGGG